MMIFLLSVFWVGNQDAGLAPLEDALWKGHITITIKGEALSQYIGNRRDAEGQATLFDQEKAKMDTDILLSVQFYINALGETTVYAVEKSKLQETVNFESKYKKSEEQEQPGGIMVPVEVQFLERKVTKIDYGREQHYDHNNLKIGSLQFSPKGRMDKKGQIQVQGEFNLVFQGSGSYELRKERQPAGDYAVLNETANINKSIEVPISFSFVVDHRRKPVEGTFGVKVDMAKIFERPENEQGAGKGVFTDKLTRQGQYLLEPIGVE
ncbi:MAG: hypothetical protein KDC71_13820 [Acidobacteria bacterium]|nr:hypothetical protein [Acidobacteriota bacterium]